MYRETDLQEEKDRVSRALGSVKDPNRIAKVLEFALSVRVFIIPFKVINIFSHRKRSEVRTQCL